MIKALIFDFDGLILETEDPYIQSVHEMYQEFGCSVPQKIYEAVGSSDLFAPYDDLQKQYGKVLDLETLRNKRRRRHYELVTAQPVLPGVIDCLREAGRLGLKLGLASSSSRDWVVGHLARVGLLEFFNSIKCADDVQRTKPDPALYLESLAGLDVSPAQAIALEDSLNGVKAAKSAGIFCIAVPSRVTRSLSFAQADLVLDSLTKLSLAKVILKYQL